MKITFEGAEGSEEQIIKFRFTSNSENDVVVEENSEGFSVIGFKVVNGKISLVRYSGIGNDYFFNVNDYGQIEEVDE